jgi:hypothetical protein
MKKTTALVANLFLSSTLFWGAATVNADELIVKTPLDLPGYCHMQFPVMRADTLRWERPLLDENSGAVIDFYGSCAHDPTGADEIRAQLHGLYDDRE